MNSKRIMRIAGRFNDYQYLKYIIKYAKYKALHEFIAILVI